MATETERTGRVKRIQLSPTIQLTMVKTLPRGGEVYIYTDTNGEYLPSITEVERGRRISKSEWKKAKEEIGQLEYMNNEWREIAIRAINARTNFLKLSKEARMQFAGTRVAPKLP